MNIWRTAEGSTMMRYIKRRFTRLLTYLLNYYLHIYLLTEAVRLAGSGLDNAGRLEINYGGIWGTVCRDNFDDDDAKVACYMLGFG